MDTPNVGHGMVEAPVQVDRIRKVYNVLSHVYAVVAFFEKRARSRGLELAEIGPTDRILEVAPGLGLTFLAMLDRVESTNVVYGIDLSPAMLRKTRTRAMRNGFSNFDLSEGDARHLPFSDGTFDLVHCSYMLDLIPLADLPRIVAGFRRVLKEEGRLLLINMSKKDTAPIAYEKLYRLTPYLWGGCRPVLMQPLLQDAGFSDVRREYLRLPVSTEIVTGVKRHCHD